MDYILNILGYINILIKFTCLTFFNVATRKSKTACVADIYIGQHFSKYYKTVEKAYIPQMALLEETRLEKVILDKQNLDRQKERGMKLL